MSAHLNKEEESRGESTVVSKCGEMATRGGFKGWQIIVAICFFPIGLLALLADRNPTTCPKCNHTWQT